MRHDTELSDRFYDKSVITSYTSKEIQSEMLSTMADMIREQITEEVKQSSVYFSLLVDFSKREQLSFVIRFVCKKQINVSLISSQRMI